MGFETIKTDHMGNLYSIDTSQYELCERIQKGDATYGWHGDPDLFVVWDSHNELFLVYKQLSAETAVLITDVSPDAFDGRVLRLLAEADTRFHDVLAEVEAHNASLDRQVAREDLAAEEELRDMQDFIARKYTSGGDEYTKGEARWVNQDLKKGN